MENENTGNKVFEKFTWTIENFSTIESPILYSEKFFIDDHTWKIVIYPKGIRNGDYLSIYLNLTEDNATFMYGPNEFIDFKFKFNLINQVNSKKNLTKEYSRTFKGRIIGWGSAQYISLAELCDSSNGFIVNDTIILEVGILSKNSEYENGVDQSLSEIEEKSVELVDNPLQKEMISSSFGGLVDFRGLGKVEQYFIPLLEEVCSRHPSLIDGMQKRSQRFIEWALTALGRVLHFLENKKVRDMDDDAYNHLQLLWDELKTCGFDLTWLEPHVKSALGMKIYAERAVRVKMLRENVVASKKETKRLKRQMFEAEVDLEITRRDLVKQKGKEGFKMCDLDAKLGY